MNGIIIKFFSRTGRQQNDKSDEGDMSDSTKTTDSSETLFVYGTLLCPELVTALTGKVFESEEAVLRGYSRYAIVEHGWPREYPAIARDPEGAVEGLLLFHVDRISLALLDEYEDSEYFREEVSAFCSKGDKTAYTYVWDPSLNHMLTSGWSLQEFRNKHLDRYIQTVVPAVLSGYSIKSDTSL